RVQQTKHLTKSLRRRDAVGEGQKPAQPVQRPGRNLLHPFPVVRSAHDPDQRRQQHLVQGIGHHPRNPVVGNNPHMIEKPKRHGVILPRLSNRTWLTPPKQFRILPCCHACSPFPRATKNGTSTQRGPDCLSGSRATAELSASTRSPVVRLQQTGPRRHHFHP